MIPVDQTRLWTGDKKDPPGNCFQACIASILGILITDVPDEMDDWSPGDDPHVSWRKFWLRFRAWIRDNHLGYIEFRLDAGADMETMLHVPFIATGKSPRGSIEHSVIMQYERKDEQTIGPVLIHDPHPSRDGLASSFETLGVFVPRKYDLLDTMPVERAGGDAIAVRRHVGRRK